MWTKQAMWIVLRCIISKLVLLKLSATSVGIYAIYMTSRLHWLLLCVERNMCISLLCLILSIASVAVCILFFHFVLVRFLTARQVVLFVLLLLYLSVKGWSLVKALCSIVFPKMHIQTANYNKKEGTCSCHKRKGDLAVWTALVNLRDQGDSERVREISRNLFLVQTNHLRIWSTFLMSPS